MAINKIVVAADEGKLEDFLSREIPPGYVIEKINYPDEYALHPNASACFILKDDYPPFSPASDLFPEVPVFIHCMNETINLSGTSIRQVRINAWPGFLRHPLLEISGEDAGIAAAGKLLNDMGWPYRRVCDQPGMVTPRVIAMLVNEACFAVQENVSSKSAIDTAMKLGTNYPLGPFEWAERIGGKQIFSLLDILSRNDARYTPAEEMHKILNISE